MKIETKNLILAKASFDDWRDLYENIWSQSESAKYMLWDVTQNEEEAKLRMEKTIAWQKEHHAYTVYEKKSGRAIGFAGFIQIDENIYEDSGIAVGPGFTGRGYGKEILRALRDICFKKLHADSFICSCRHENIASRKMILSCGFHFTHSESRTDKRNNRDYEIEFYELRRTEI